MIFLGSITGSSLKKATNPRRGIDGESITTNITSRTLALDRHHLLGARLFDDGAFPIGRECADKIRADRGIARKSCDATAIRGLPRHL